MAYPTYHLSHTFHFLCLVSHLIQTLLIGDHLLYPLSYLSLQLLHFLICFVELVNFGEIVVLRGKLVCSFLCIGFDILLSFILTVVDLLYFCLQFGYQTVCMPLRVGLTSANSIGDVIIVMGDIPDAVCSPQFITLATSRF